MGLTSSHGGVWWVLFSENGVAEFSISSNIISSDDRRRI